MTWYDITWLGIAGAALCLVIAIVWAGSRSSGAASINTAQPPPANRPSSPPIWPLVVADMNGRDTAGRTKYGVPLVASNGRDHLMDAYEESLDLAVYLRAAIYERDGK